MAPGHPPHAAHGHDHERAHLPGARRSPEERRRERRRLVATLAMVSVYMLAEVMGGVMSGSLALLADAGHMASDAAALALSLFALWIADRPPDSRRTYGHQRAEILAALANGVGLLVVAVLILSEAVERIASPPEVRGGMMLVVAAGGLVVNLVGLALLHGGSQHSLNVRGAFLHVLSDAMGSVGALAAGAGVLLFDWRWADPAASLLIAVLIVLAAGRLVLEAADVLMEAAPRHLDVDEIRRALLELPEVASVHDLHVWTISSGVVALSCHVVAAAGARSAAALAATQECLLERFGIDHATIQVETDSYGAPASDDPCADAACDTASAP